MTQLVHDQRQVRDHDQGHGRRPPGRDTAPAARGGAPESGQESGRHRNHDHAGGNVRLHRHGAPCGRHEPPLGPSGSPRLPGAQERHGRRRLDQGGIPHEGGVADQAGRDRRQDGRHQARRDSTDRARDPPHDRHDQQAQERDLRHDERRVAAADPHRREEQVVIQGAVVEVAADADRQRPESRQTAAIDRVPQRQHLGALVGVPAASGRQVGEARCGGRGEDGGQAAELADLHSQASAHAGDAAREHGPRTHEPAHAPARPPACAGVSAVGPACGVGPGPVPGLGRGPGVSGLPATRSPTRAMLIASKPSSIPGVSR